MEAWLMSHLLVVLLVWAVFFLVSCAAGAMLPPEEGHERSFYGWFYRFAQRLVANAAQLERAAVARYLPQIDSRAGGLPGESGSVVVRDEQVAQRTITAVQS